MKKIAVVTLAISLTIPFSVSPTYAKQGPGPAKPIDIKEIGNGFDTQDNWEVNGAVRSDSGSGAKFTLNSNKATISKHFNDYPVWDYSDLHVNIKDISDGAKWKLTVKGNHDNAKEMTIQQESENANSEFGESFVYSLEGLAGSEYKSDWNKEGVNKSFTLTFTVTGDSGDTITLGDLESVKPNYEIPKALSSNVDGKIAGVNFNGDPNLDVDTLKNDDLGYSFSTDLNEHQWMSLPYSRLVVHPEYYFDNGKITPVSEDLDLEFGVYYGIKGNANETLGASEGKSGFQPSSYNSILKIDGQSIDKNSVTSAWYPHKLVRSADFNDKGHVDLTDFMIDNNTIGRIIDTSKVNGNLEIIVKDGASSGSARYVTNLKSTWDENNKVVIKSDNQRKATDLFNQSIKVIALNEDGSLNQELTDTITTPNFQNGEGKYIVPNTVKKVGLVIGYSNREEGKQKSIDRANEAINSNLLKCYNKTKDYWNQTLRKVPVPDEWGIQDKNIKGYDTVSKEEHKILYYSGWVHNLTNTLAPTPETGYAYTMQALGKPSRQVGGAAMTPANNCWEGLLQIQNIMYVDPSAAWSGMEGFMAMVDANGFLDGEVLPVRMAQTLWMLHSISPDTERLKAIYPTLKRHLQYKISDPRWIYGSVKTQNEIDQEYITSWMNDVIYMKKICAELGGKYEKDIDYWSNEYNKAMKNYTDWFFSDPMSHEAKGSYPTDSSPDQQMRNGAGLPTAQYQRGLWTRIFHINGDVTAIEDTCNKEDGPHYAHTNQGGHRVSPSPGRYPREWLQVILAGLVLPDIPSEQLKQLEQLFLDVNNPALSLSGLENLKWAPASLLIYGLVNKGFYDEAKNQLDSYLVKSVDVWQFCENYKYNATGPYGTHATSFGASQIIELTMLKNGVMNDGSGVKAIKNWDEGINKAKNPEINISLENAPDINVAASKLPAEITQVYNREGTDGEKYTLNKVTAVTWEKDKMIASDNPNVFIFNGETETHDKVSATVIFNATKDTLETLINDANNLVSKAEVGEGNGQYPQSSVDKIRNIISNATEILNKDDATTDEIGKFILDLSNGVEEFKNSKIVVNVDKLNTKIQEAEELLNNSETGDRNGQYPLESKKQFKQAIKKAKEVANNDKVTEKEVEASLNSLEEAIKIFKDSKIIINKEKLQNLVNKCEEILNKAEAGDKEGQYPQKSINEFKDGINEAKNVLSNDKLNQKELDQAIKLLNKALEKFEKSVISVEEGGNITVIPNPDDSNKSNQGVQTGDETPLAALLGAVAAASVGIYLSLKKKKVK